MWPVDQWYAWIGEINAIPGMRREIVGLICVTVAAASGAVIGLERESQDKPAGLRTLILICLGSTIFTLVSLLLATQKQNRDSRTAGRGRFRVLSPGRPPAL